MRRALRLNNKLWNTEKAYVGKIYAFMRDRGLKSLADFEAIGASDVEAHLTDLVVDGDVAVSTQNQAFSALLFLFEYVLHRDFVRLLIPLPLLLESKRRGDRVLGTLVDGTWDVPTTLIFVVLSPSFPIVPPFCG